MLFTKQNEEPKKVEDITFTQKCILMSCISSEKSKILITSFYDIPLVKLYTANLNTKNLIYSKVKGALCFFRDKDQDDQNSRKYYLRIYSLKNYSLLFNIELAKEDLKHYIKIKEILYGLQTKQYLIAFKFNSKENAEKFYSQIRNEPNKDVVTQNEKAFNIKSSQLNPQIYKEIIDSIKDELKNNNKKKPVKPNSAITAKTNISKANTKISVNDTPGDYIDFSNISFLYLLSKNIEYDTDENKLDFFINDELNKRMCQDIINQFNKNNSPNFPMQIIDKDYNNILNKKKYIEFMTNNIIQTIKEQQDLIKYKNASSKKQLKQKQLDLQNKLNNNSSNSNTGRLSIGTRKSNAARKSINTRKVHSMEKRKNRGNKRLSTDLREVKTPSKEENKDKTKSTISKDKSVKNEKTVNKPVEARPLTSVKPKGKEGNFGDKKRDTGFMGGLFKKKNKK